MKKVIGLALCGAFFVSAAMADTLTERLDKALLEVNATKNAAARAEYAIKRAKEAHAADVKDDLTVEPVQEPIVAPVDPAPVVEPAPAPAPVVVEPAPPLPSPVALDGEADAITTASGTWRVTRLAAQGDIIAYRWTLDGKPDWKRIVAVRALSSTALTALDEQPITIDGVTMTVAPGAVRVWQNASPVAWRWDWLKAAVDQGRTAGIGSAPVAKMFSPLTLPALPAYDPTVISPLRAGTVATSSANSVGTTSGQGGEYDASRGFYHNYDATAVQMAQAGTGTAEMAAFLERITLDQLSHPQAAPWSINHDGQADPQIPYEGDAPWVGPYPGGSVPSAPSWGRDTQHLENACWAHWLATADPLAGMCVQRQLGFMLAEHHSVWRPKDGRYSYPAGIERVNWNALVSAWKTRDVARGVSATGKTLYDRGRAEKMFADIVLYTDEQVARPIYTQDIPSEEALTSGNPNLTLPVARYSAKIAGAIFHSYNIQGASYRLEADGTKSWFMGGPDFMTGQYGGVILPLLVKDGNETARVWAAHLARYLAARLALGYRGVEGTEEVRGSVVAYGPAVWETRSYSNWGPKEQAWAAMPTTDYKTFLDGFNRGPTDSFDGSNVHTVIQMRNLLAGLKAAGVPVDDAALAKADALIAATTDWKHQLRAKHLGIVN